MQLGTLATELVKMRPLEKQDSAPIFELARAPEIAENTFVPHPYTAQDAESFVERALEQRRLGEAYVFAIIDRTTDEFAGLMGIHPEAEHKRAFVGYWIGKPFWGRGLATAALRLLIQYGFEELNLNRIEAEHFHHNPASGRVMQKANMSYEGTRRQALIHRDQVKDLMMYAILRDEYQNAKRDSQ